MRGTLVILLLLTGCGPSLSGATPAGGIISTYNAGKGKSLRIAQEHCARYGKDARPTGDSFLNDTLTFDCVAR